jgi:hypothetical protein
MDQKVHTHDLRYYEEACPGLASPKQQAESALSRACEKLAFYGPR